MSGILWHYVLFYILLFFIWHFLFFMFIDMSLCIFFNVGLIAFKFTMVFENRWIPFEGANFCICYLHWLRTWEIELVAVWEAAGYKRRGK